MRPWVIGAGCTMALCLSLASSNYGGYTIYLDHKEVATAKSTKELTQGMEQAEKDINKRFNLEKAYIKNEIHIKNGWIGPSSNFSTEKEVFENISKEVLDIYVSGVVVKVSQKEKEFFEDKETAKKAVDKIIEKKTALKEGETLKSINIISSIDIEPKEFPITQLSFDEVPPLLDNNLKEIEEKKSFEAFEKNKLITLSSTDKLVEPVVLTALSEIQKSKPVIEGEKILEDLDFEIKKEVQEKEVVPFQIEKIEDPNLYFDQGEVITQNGVNGELTRDVAITIDKALETRTVNKEEITVPVSNQVITKGTKVYPTRYGKKDGLILPANGIITALDKPGSHGDGRAVDIANDMDTPIYAPIDGEITLSEYYGGYGNAIEITNNETGYQILLGHMNELLAPVGTIVKKGEIVGLMGSTGNSTGPHVHMEIFKHEEKQFIADYFDLTMYERVSEGEISTGQTEQTQTYQFPATDINELDLFYRCVMAEAGGEDYEGMVAVASCIITTAQKNSISITEVIMSPLQYSCVDDGRIYEVTPTETTKKATDDALNGLRVLDNNTQYFYAPGTVESPWHESLIYTGTLGGHRFFKAN